MELNNFNELLLQLESENKKNIDINVIKKAYEYANNHHKDQMRQSGDPYITHPLNVAKIVLEFGLDEDSIVAAILHDVIEDTDASYEEIKSNFGEEVANLVDGVTKLGKIPYSSKEEEQIEYLRKMFFAMAKDIRVILIKLADRLHNMRTLSACSHEKQLRIALETMEIYAPLSHRLGMQMVKLELEDISLKYLDPIGYKMIEDKLKEKVHDAEGFINDTLENIKSKFDSHDIDFKIEYRIKHIFSIYKKIFTQQKNFEDIYDIFAFRLIVDSISDCYYLLGLIHDIFNPIPGRFKDYISTPKPNMYQSLHTTVIGKDGIPFEVQIRTWDMHNTAEYGIAAHWKYKQGINKSNETVDSKLKWVRGLLEMHEDVSDTEDFIRALKIDIFEDEVFVFTPKGDVIDLPMGSTVVDYAYAIHSAVGNKMIGAKVNGKIVQLDYKLSNGEIIEILTTSAQGHGPSRDWLNFVKTSEAKNKIRHWFKRECRDDNIKHGTALIDNELKKLGIVLSGEIKENILKTIASRQNFPTVDDLYATIGYGGVSINKIINKVKDEALKLQKETKEIKIVTTSKPKASAGGVIIEGVDNCLVKFAHCCNPLPGDYIIGFITRGFGVSIHNIDCPNAKKGLEKEPERWIKAHWDEKSTSSFESDIELLVKDNVGVMANIAQILSDMNVSLRKINSRPERDLARMNITVDVRDLNHLNHVISNLRKNKDVINVKRV